MQIEDGFHLTISIDDIPASGLDIKPEIPAAILPSLCERFLVDGMKNIELKAHASRFDRDGFYLRGVMKAEVLQSCVISLEPVWSLVNASFEVEFQPADRVAEMDIDPDDFETEVPEPIGADGADIGDVIAQIFALEIPLYPKHPDAVLDQAFSANEPEKPASPFAVLQNYEKK